MAFANLHPKATEPGGRLYFLAPPSPREKPDRSFAKTTHRADRMRSASTEPVASNIADARGTPRVWDQRLRSLSPYQSGTLRSTGGVGDFFVIYNLDHIFLLLLSIPPFPHYSSPPPLFFLYLLPSSTLHRSLYPPRAAIQGRRP